MATIPLNHFLLVAAALFSIGLMVVLTKRNLIVILMGVELMLNAANLNLVAFSRYDPTLSGQFFALFVMVVAASEAAVALGIILLVVKHYRSLDITEVSRLSN